MRSSRRLLFLAAGSVIIALHHEQDMRRMGGLKKYMPITYWTMVIGAISSAGIPGFAGFFSKDAIIEAMKESHTRARSSRTSAWCRACSSPPRTPSACSSWRSTAQSRFDASHPPHESPAVVTVPLRAPRHPFGGGGLLRRPGACSATSSAAVRCRRPKANSTASAPYMLHGLVSLPFWLALAGHRHGLRLVLEEDGPAEARGQGLWVRSTPLVERKYGFDELYSWLFAGGARDGRQRVLDGRRPDA